MKLTQSQHLILYALGHFYQAINQPLTKKPLVLQTSKITFIELLLDSKLISKQERALYKNLKALEKNKLIAYDQKMIRFTETGLQELRKTDEEVKKFIALDKYFASTGKSKRKLQTVIKD